MFEALLLVSATHCTFQGEEIKVDSKVECKRELLVKEAKAKKKEHPQYVLGADGPNTFDCSGFTMWTYRQIGKELPHFSGAQMDRGQPVHKKKNLKKGDLLFFGPGGSTHVSMYIGNGKMIHTSSSGNDIGIDNINESWYKQRYAGARRYLSGN